MEPRSGGRVERRRRRDAVSTARERLAEISVEAGSIPKEASAPASGRCVSVQRRPAMSEDTIERSELERLRAENARLKSQGARSVGLTFKVSEKGAVSVYGLGRFPVTLYQEQWDKLLGQIDELRAFIDANRASLKKKEAAT
jgi:hypothetical protein